MKLPDESLKSVYKKQARVALVGLVAEVPNFVLTIIFACMASTILCWIDAVVSFAVILHYTIVVFVSYKMAKEDGDKYNYGLERLEVFTSFICDLIISITMLVLLGSSIYGIIVPEQPQDGLLWFLLLKVSNTAFDVYFVINGIKIVKKRRSRLNETELTNYINNLIHDALILVASIVCYFLRENVASAYISSIVGIVSILYFLYTYIKHLRLLIKELSDKSISIKDQDELYDFVLENSKGIKRIKAVNCHTLNGILNVDINLSFKDEITYEEQVVFIKTIKELIQEKNPGAKVRLVIDE